MTKRSLVLVTVDCLRADHVGFHGYSRPITPFLDSLAKESIVFQHAIAAGVPTYFAFPAILAARHPLDLGRSVVGIAPGEPTLATVLQEEGYKTAAFLAGNPYLSARFGYHQGFERFEDFLGRGSAEATVAAPSHEAGLGSALNRWVRNVSRLSAVTAAAYDELYFWYCQGIALREDLPVDRLRRYPAAHVMVDQVCSWLEQAGDHPFFLWLHLMDPHHPYYPPEEAVLSLGSPTVSPRRAHFLNSFWNRDDIGPKRLQQYRDEIVSLYDAGVHWVDKQLSWLIATLRRLRRWDQTIFAVTADHGEEFLEHGARYHSPSNLPEQLIHVPLLLRSPELSSGQVVRNPFSLIHLAPTLLGAIGSTIPDSFKGKNYWPDLAKESLQCGIAVCECLEACNNPLRMDERLRPRLLAVRDGRCKLIVRFSDRADFLYDLKEDDEEGVPLLDSSRTMDRARLLRAAAAHLETAEGRDLKVALRARLRDVRQR